MPLTGVRRAVRESFSGLPRAFWWLWTSSLVNRLGGFVAAFLTIYLTSHRGFSASYAGLVTALYGLGGAVSAVVAGVLTDRLGRRPTLLIAQTSTAASVALLGFVTHPVAIAAVALLVGATSNASRPAVQAMMADIVRPEDRMRAYSLNYWAINLGFAISSAAAGFIAEVSYTAGFLVEAGMTLVCALVVFAKLPESRPERAGSGQPGGKAGAGGAAQDAAQDAAPAPSAGLGTVLRDGRFMGVVGLSLMVMLIFQQGFVGLPIAMAQAGFTPADYGTSIAVNGLLVVALQIPVTRLIEHRSAQRLLTVAALLAGYGFGLTAFADSIGLFILSVSVWSIGEIINAPTQSSLVVRLSPVHGRGRYQGVYSLNWALATLLGPLMAGLIIDHWGANWLWIGCAALGMVAALGYALLMHGIPAHPSGTRDTVPDTKPDTKPDGKPDSNPDEKPSQTTV